MTALKKIWLYARLRKAGVPHDDAMLCIKKVCLPSWWTDKTIKHFIW